MAELCFYIAMMRVRFPNEVPSFISVKCYQVALAVWGGRVQVRILAWRPILPLSYNGQYTGLRSRELKFDSLQRHQV